MRIRYPLIATTSVLVLVAALIAVSPTASGTDVPRRLECTITGTNGDDVIHGTNGPDVICARGGRNDEVYGRGGDDVLILGRGSDFFQGGEGTTASTGVRASIPAGADPAMIVCSAARKGIRRSSAAAERIWSQAGVDPMCASWSGMVEGTIASEGAPDAIRTKQIPAMWSVRPRSTTRAWRGASC